eukprot:Rmarinus@m.3119
MRQLLEVIDDWVFGYRTQLEGMDPLTCSRYRRGITDLGKHQLTYMMTQHPPTKVVIELRDGSCKKRGFSDPQACALPDTIPQDMMEETIQPLFASYNNFNREIEVASQEVRRAGAHSNAATLLSATFGHCVLSQLASDARSAIAARALNAEEIDGDVPEIDVDVVVDVVDGVTIDDTSPSNSPAKPTCPAVDRPKSAFPGTTSADGRQHGALATRPYSAVEAARSRSSTIDTAAIHRETVRGSEAGSLRLRSAQDRPRSSTAASAASASTSLRVRGDQARPRSVPPKRIDHQLTRTGSGQNVDSTRPRSMSGRPRSISNHSKTGFDPRRATRNLIKSSKKRDVSSANSSSKGSTPHLAKSSSKERLSYVSHRDSNETQTNNRARTSCLDVNITSSPTTRRPSLINPFFSRRAMGKQNRRRLVPSQTDLLALVEDVAVRSVIRNSAVEGQQCSQLDKSFQSLDVSDPSALPSAPKSPSVFSVLPVDSVTDKLLRELREDLFDYITEDGHVTEEGKKLNSALNKLEKTLWCEETGEPDEEAVMAQTQANRFGKHRKSTLKISSYNSGNVNSGVSPSTTPVKKVPSGGAPQSPAKSARHLLREKRDRERRRAQMRQARLECVQEETMKRDTGAMPTFHPFIQDHQRALAVDAEQISHPSISITTSQDGCPVVKTVGFQRGRRLEELNGTRRRDNILARQSMKMRRATVMPQQQQQQGGTQSEASPTERVDLETLRRNLKVVVCKSPFQYGSQSVSASGLHDLYARSNAARRREEQALEKLHEQYRAAKEEARLQREEEEEERTRKGKKKDSDDSDDSDE